MRSARHLAPVHLAAVGALALLASLAAASARTADGGGERWTTEELAVIASMNVDRLPASRPDPSNRYEDSPAARALGRDLFFDVRLSANGAVACATCHDPARQFQDGRPVGIGVGVGTRRAMPIVGAGYGAWFFWDGRKDSLWSQALGPLEDAREHGANRVQIVRLVARHHREAYVAAFGTPPDVDGLPEAASPLGTAAERAAWQRLDARQQAEVSRAFANVGKAIAAYEKSLRPVETRFDRYAAQLQRGDAGAPALDARERHGLRLFIGKGQCVTCHGGRC